MILRKLINLLFPPKCVFCRCLLTDEETDLCHTCRKTAPEFISEKRSFENIAEWTAVWYYRDKVRGSIHRFKFWNARGYAGFYGKMLALKLQESDFAGKYDLITWTPVSPFRRLRRGYDQTRLVALALGRELGIKPVRALFRVRHTKPQSRMASEAHRRANVKGAYRCINRKAVAEKRVLLLDDVLTTGATADEAAKTLRFVGAKDIYFAAIAAARKDKTK